MAGEGGGGMFGWGKGACVSGGCVWLRGHVCGGGGTCVVEHTQAGGGGGGGTHPTGMLTCY